MDKQQVVRDSEQYWNPAKTRDWQKWGIDLVIGKREGYFIYDMDGRKFIDMHLNGGTFNLGHRHPEVIDALNQATAEFDAGNHHFPSSQRASLAKTLVELSPGMSYCVFATSGSEAIDIAVKTVRQATKKKKIVSVNQAYHGHTGYSLQVGDEVNAKYFNCEPSAQDSQRVPFNDLASLEQVLAQQDVAAVILETIPATAGFVMPDAGYLQGVRALCDKYNVFYIADEVQTGLMRTGQLWAVQTYGVTPDIIITGKGIGGGIYPIAAALLSEKAGQWLNENGFGHVSTYGGSELGCVVASKVLEITTRPETQLSVEHSSLYIREGLDRLRARYPDFFIGIRQCGLVFGLEFNHPEGALHIMGELYKQGVWAILSSFNPSVLQLKPGLLIDREISDDMLYRFDLALRLVTQQLKNAPQNSSQFNISNQGADS
ncbi:aminotransferase class III-fold pyridoxal phosphate-dependent enzyme [Vibrio europaeus]|uniref:class-III pyridoxal-phosphate-dependent aminotransferase n=1 Tax=Vibrio europaeus TaxID=300876 RepID=UPI001E47FE7E|nr:aminotransferase class III-fold pyridoxal phosphate-dependent enzyme [Vibrio europaeus]MDC5812483.1 aminotransferase class III-fold pyridoxal phosphate-dependent enzyme [Vibrio europaeus]